MLGGVGFTMAIFVTNLAFVDASTIAMAKAAILAARSWPASPASSCCAA